MSKAERDLETHLIEKLQGLKYQYRDDTRDDGTPLNFTLVNIKDWCKNTFEVVNQLRINTDNSHHRYDVMLLINGVPAVQIELKTLGISPRRAMQQIVDYKTDPGNGYTRTLLCFVQLFIVSNRDTTYCFTNNNAKHFAFNADERFLPVYQFAAEDNSRITHLDDFADKFLAKCTLGRMISRYTVLVASEQKLLMMRPYQIYAVQQIVDCIEQNGGNGYIWHTTGSGKTLTSFKAPTLLKANDTVHKCLFVVDMLLTGFDSKYLNTLYVDKKLKHHGLIQAFSRTNRVLNDTKPYGHILDFRGQQDSVDEAIALFSGAKGDSAREIWLVDKAPVVIERLQQAKADLDEFMQSQGLESKPGSVANLRGDDARAGFVQRFKEVQRLQTQLDQYTDLTDEQKQIIEQTLSKDDLRSFRGAYIETAKQLRELQRRPGETSSPLVDELDFELVLFASATIDYDYIMNLIARFSQQTPGKSTISREQLIGLIQSDSKFIDDADAIAQYVRTLEIGRPLGESVVREGYQQYKIGKESEELAGVADKHGLVHKQRTSSSTQF